MTPTITAFERSPDRGQGLARDMPVRWALEEVGQPYDVRLVSFSEMKKPAHRALHPFGQIPTYQEGDLALFESGAIVLHIAQRHGGLLPGDANARARAITWMFAAVSTLEPPIVDLDIAELLECEESWYAQRLPAVNIRTSPPMSPAAKRGRPSGGPSMHNWRFSPRHRPADEPVRGPTNSRSDVATKAPLTWARRPSHCHF
jgi:glutathione S-transferase